MAGFLKLSCCDDLQLESHLRALSVSQAVRTIKFSQLDLKESQYNGARIEDPIVRFLVEDYKTGMENGDTFPRIAVYEDKKGTYVILSGNQRSVSIDELIKEGKISKLLTLEVYVVDTADPLLREVIARSANVSHGGRSSRDERLAHAIYSVRKLGMRPKAKAVKQALKHPKGVEMSDSQIAEHVGVAISTVGKYREELEVTLGIGKSPERTGRDGRTINTANIGKKPATCRNCGHDEFDEDGDCAKCHEPAAPPATIPVRFQEPTDLKPRRLPDDETQVVDAAFMARLTRAGTARSEPEDEEPDSDTSEPETHYEPSESQEEASQSAGGDTTDAPWTQCRLLLAEEFKILDRDQFELRLKNILYAISGEEWTVKPEGED